MTSRVLPSSSWNSRRSELSGCVEDSGDHQFGVKDVSLIVLSVHFGYGVEWTLLFGLTAGGDWIVVAPAATIQSRFLVAGIKARAVAARSSAVALGRTSYQA